MRSKSRIYISTVSWSHLRRRGRAPDSLLCFVFFYPALHNGYKTCLTGPECLTAAALSSVIQASGSDRLRTRPVSSLRHRSLPIQLVNNRPLVLRRSHGLFKRLMDVKRDDVVVVRQLQSKINNNHLHRSFSLQLIVSVSSSSSQSTMWPIST